MIKKYLSSNPWAKTLFEFISKPQGVSHIVKPPEVSELVLYALI